MIWFNPWQGGSNRSFPLNIVGDRYAYEQVNFLSMCHWQIHCRDLHSDPKHSLSSQQRATQALHSSKFSGSGKLLACLHQPSCADSWHPILVAECKAKNLFSSIALIVKSMLRAMLELLLYVVLDPIFWLFSLSSHVYFADLPSRVVNCIPLEGVPFLQEGSAPAHTNRVS